MGRRKRSEICSDKDYEEGQDIEAPSSPYNESKKKLFFEDPLMDNIQIENISISDVRRITNKTFDFLRSTGLRQTHISATSGINQSILSIILRDPGTKTISLNRKRDIVAKLCEYYRKINEGVISHDPQTAPKICTRKKSTEDVQRKRVGNTVSVDSHFIKNKTSEANFENGSDLQTVEIGNNECSKNREVDPLNKELMDNIHSNENAFTLQENRYEEPFDSGERCGDYYIVDLCVNCLNKGVKSEKELLEFKETSSGPIFSYIYGGHDLEYLDMESTSYIENIVPAFENRDPSFLRFSMSHPILIPLTVNMRHYTVNEGNGSTRDNGNSHITKPNPVAFLSSIKGKGYKADNFVWRSTSETELLWSYIENLCRERHLSPFISDRNKRKIFLWLRKEIQNYKNLYLEFLYIIWKSGINPASNPNLMYEINLNETHDDVVIIDKFKWNISQSTFLLKKQIGHIVSDLKLPHELFSALLHSALKQLFDSIIDFMRNFDGGGINTSFDYSIDEPQKPNSHKADDTSSICSSGASSTANKGDLRSDYNTEFVSTNRIMRWGDEAELDYDSDDNAIIYPIVESAAVKKQIENRNRFTKRRL